MLAPVLVSVYSRLGHFQKCIEALQKNELANETELFVVSDGAARPEHERAVQQVREYAKTISGFKKVHLILRAENQGMFKSIISAHDELLEKYGRLIFLEDDIITAPTFLTYMNEGLDFYEKNNNIFSIHGYSYPVDYPQSYSKNKDLFLFPRYNPWGVGLWQEKWSKLSFDQKEIDLFLEDRNTVRDFLKVQPNLLSIMENKILAADVMISYHLFKNNLNGVYPINTQTLNAGFDDSGDHCGTNPVYANQIFSENLRQPTMSILKQDERILKTLRHFFGYPTLTQRLTNKINRLFAVGE